MDSKGPKYSKDLDKGHSSKHPDDEQSHRQQPFRVQWEMALSMAHGDELSGYAAIRI